MSNLADLALEAAVLKVLADEIAARQQAVKAELAARFEDVGATQAVPSIPGGAKVATVSLAGSGGTSASVTAELPFLNWVATNYPDEIDFKVRDSFKKKILDQAKKNGDVIPGVTLAPSSPYVSVRFRPGGADAIAQAWRDGELRSVEIVAPAAIEHGSEAA